MAVYEYSCDDDGRFDIMRPLGTAPSSTPCPDCGADSPRVFSKPMLKSSMPRELISAMDHAEKTADAPDIVTSLPRSGARRRTPVLPLTPTLRRLPRP